MTKSAADIERQKDKKDAKKKLVNKRKQNEEVERGKDPKVLKQRLDQLEAEYATQTANKTLRDKVNETRGAYETAMREAAEVEAAKVAAMAEAKGKSVVRTRVRGAPPKVTHLQESTAPTLVSCMEMGMGLPPGIVMGGVGGIPSPPPRPPPPPPGAHPGSMMLVGGINGIPPPPPRPSYAVTLLPPATSVLVPSPPGPKPVSAPELPAPAPTPLPAPAGVPPVNLVHIMARRREVSSAIDPVGPSIDLPEPDMPKTTTEPALKRVKIDKSFKAFQPAALQRPRPAASTSTMKRVSKVSKPKDQCEIDDDLSAFLAEINTIPVKKQSPPTNKLALPMPTEVAAPASVSVLVKDMPENENESEDDFEEEEYIR
jgi:hypothetical protein